MDGPGVRLRIGLTGGIGSGKSTVGAMLQRRGARLVDTDAIAASPKAVRTASTAAPPGAVSSRAN